jgi:tetrapyrrole methylase family protein/MazG family protein
MSESIAELIETVRRLRAPGGCPWDREQTHQSLRKYLIEEAYEVLDVLDRIPSDALLKTDGKVRDEFKSELGDLWMQVLLHSQMASETGAFDIHDVARELNAKLIRRHPHVFGETRAADAEEAYKSWEKQKAEEKKSNPEASVLDGVPRGLPALQKTARVIDKLTRVGFQWSDLHGPLEKVKEEFAELSAEIQTDPKSAKVSHELGDLLFSICNLAAMLKLNPEDSLRSTLDRVQKRFRHVEKRLKDQGKNPEQSTLAEMDSLWNEAKALLD